MKYLAFDLRALSLMRICMAAVIIIDLSIRISDLEAFYANSGAAPLSMIFEHAWNKYYISFHTMSGLWQVQFLLFMFAFFCAMMLLIGYRTRLFTFLSWLMLLSLHNRNVFILQGGDDLLRMVMFWAMFLPWGARYSCDRLMDEQKEPGVQYYSLACVAYLLQVCYLYTGSALLKGAEWNTNYTAVYYAYSLDQIAYPITRYLYYYPELLKKLTFVAYYFELLVPLLFFIPFKHAWFRLGGVLMIICFHLWNSVTLLIGLFPLIGIATVMGLIPTPVMDAVDRQGKKIKLHIAASFMGIAYAVQKILPWKKQVYAGTWLHERVTAAVLVFLILFVADWNMSNLHFVGSKIPGYMNPIAYTLRIDQSWGMFAPGVLKDDGWYVFEATCKDGKCINLLSPEGKLSYKKPGSVTAMFKNDRWRKFAENLIFVDNSFLRLYFCNYYKRLWNKRNPAMNIKELKVVYMNELTRPDYEYVIPEKAELCDCLDE